VPGLVPGIHVFAIGNKDVDGRDKPGHDDQYKSRSLTDTMLFTADHDEVRRALQKFIAAEINPHVDEWEDNDIFPAHELFKKLGHLGFLGLNKPAEFGGQGLDYSYALMMAEELGAIECGGVPMAIGVQTDMATPALARFGSDEVRREFLAPAISGDAVACIGGAGADELMLMVLCKIMGIVPGLKKGNG
jgi:citronellyl-CoA dehydrogenase